MTRLTYPRRFTSEAMAKAEAHAYGMWNIGGMIVPAGKYFEIVIDTMRPDALLQYLKQQMPDMVWTRSDIPREWPT